MISNKVKPIGKNNLVYAREDGTMPMEFKHSRNKNDEK
jgi:hypothetical protein